MIFAALAFLVTLALASIGAAITAAYADNSDIMPAVTYSVALATLAYLGLR